MLIKLAMTSIEIIKEKKNRAGSPLRSLVIRFCVMCKAYDEFIRTYHLYLDKNIPQKTVRFNKLKHKKENWMTRGLLKSMKIRNSLFLKMKHETNPEKRNDLQMKYKQYRNTLNQLIRRAKKIYWENSFKDSERDMKATWQKINKVLNRSKNTPKSPESFKHENTHYTNPLTISNGFNNFFTNIGPHLAQNIPVTHADPKDYLPPLDLRHSFVLIPTTSYEVEKLLKNMNPKLSHGHDSISSKLSKLS